MYRAEHRALRELHATGRQLASHWWRSSATASATRPPRACSAGAATARGLVSRAREGDGASAACTASRPPRASARGSPGCATPPATSCSSATRRCGSRCSTPSTSRRCCSTSPRSPSGATTRRWRRSTTAGPRRSAAARDAVRAAAIGLADNPEDAIRPAEPSVLGRAGHGAAQRARHRRRGDRRLAARQGRAARSPGASRGVGARAPRRPAAARPSAASRARRARRPRRASRSTIRGRPPSSMIVPSEASDSGQRP